MFFFLVIVKIIFLISFFDLGFIIYQYAGDKGIGQVFCSQDFMYWYDLLVKSATSHLCCIIKKTFFNNSQKHRTILPADKQCIQKSYIKCCTFQIFDINVQRQKLIFLSLTLSSYLAFNFAENDFFLEKPLLRLALFKGIKFFFRCTFLQNYVLQ